MPPTTLAPRSASVITVAVRVYCPARANEWPLAEMGVHGYSWMAIRARLMAGWVPR
jgi:hypothetical protein